MKVMKWAMVGITIALVTGLVAYGGLRQNRTAQAADPTPTPGQRGQAPGAGGACTSNEDPAHEAQETAEQEAAENACQGHGGRGGPGGFGDLFGAAATKL